MISFQTNVLNSNLLQGMSKRQENISNSLEKLSSGLRINRAADDAAGSSISSRFTSQIRGNTQGVQNIQDGLSMIQVADSGLGSILNTLQRIRELALMASNGTYNKDDRQYFQTEVKELLQHIDNVSKSTYFNGVNPLGPTHLSGGNAKADVVFMLDDSGSMSPYQTALANNLPAVMDTLRANGIGDVRFGVLEFVNGTYNFANFSGSKWSSDPNAVKAFIQSAALSNPGAIENGMEAIDQSVAFYDFRQDNGMKIAHLVMLTNEDADDGERVDEISTLLATQNIQFHTVFSPTALDFDSGAGDPPNTDEYKRLVDETGGVSVDINSPTWGDDLSTILANTIAENASLIPFTPTLELQTGYQSKDRFTIEFLQTTIAALGINNLDVTDTANLDTTLNKIDTAMEAILGQRTKFGAYTNRLQEMTNHLSQSNVVAKSVSAKITDADMSKEMTDFTKEKLLLSANISMLQTLNSLQQEYVQGLILSQQ